MDVVGNAYGPTDMHGLYNANAIDAEVEELAHLYSTSLPDQELISTKLGEGVQCQKSLASLYATE